MAKTHLGSAAAEADKAGDGVPGYTSTISVTLDNSSICFIKKEKVLLCHGFGVCKAL